MGTRGRNVQTNLAPGLETGDAADLIQCPLTAAVALRPVHGPVRPLQQMLPTHVPGQRRDTAPPHLLTGALETSVVVAAMNEAGASQGVCKPRRGSFLLQAEYFLAGKPPPPRFG